MPAAIAARPVEAPHALPLLGHAGQLWFRPLPFIRELAYKHGLVTLRLGPYRAYLACGTADVLEVLHDARTFDKGGPLFEKARLLVGDGLVSSDFTTHRRQRLLLQPAFHTARLPGYQQLMARQVDATLATWRTGQVLDLGHAMHTLTLRVAARTMFGARLDDRAIGEVVAAMPVIMRGVYQRMVLPVDWTHRLPLPANRRFERARATMHRVIGDTVRAYRRSGQDHHDLLSILVHGRDEHGAGLTEEEIHDQVMTLLIGATEPPGDALTWIFSLLAAHPDAERAVRAEADHVLGCRPATVLTPDDLPRLEHTHRVVREALRLYPPAWLLTRTTTRDTRLAGHPVKKGSTVLFSPYQTQHDPRVFPEPRRFDPDRWRAPTAAARLAMLPFGAGNRKCIGDEVALTELVGVTAAVAARFRLRPVSGTTPRPVARASLGADRVLMTVQSRRPNTVRSLPGRTGTAAS
ncbi:cytochrome P450 [Streptomyces longisporoflavus]|uniref:cytochrome P450 n=1 Tax=Streptomyces longisporoflavus TaxID=28044 RepID=UPI0019B00E1B|nr:cytochrome P450 [Streptomyces longisporoflavus]GGV58737.1 cytochrome P450 [Streptomyces longisporoflavus]